MTVTQVHNTQNNSKGLREQNSVHDSDSENPNQKRTQNIQAIIKPTSSSRLFAAEDSFDGYN